MELIEHVFNLDSSLYAHYVFKAFDVNCNGAISFRDHIVTLSTLLRGSVYERLKWTFKLYDLNGDGCISRGELTEVVQAVHELMGRRIENDDRKTREQVRKSRIFFTVGKARWSHCFISGGKFAKKNVKSFFIFELKKLYEN